jgi:hypothetical protein
VGNFTHISAQVNPFDNLPYLAAMREAQSDEFETYLSERCVVPANDDALEWWYNHREDYPQLSRMAMDYLSIPGTSTTGPSR